MPPSFPSTLLVCPLNKPSIHILLSLQSWKIRNLPSSWILLHHFASPFRNYVSSAIAFSFQSCVFNGNINMVVQMVGGYPPRLTRGIRLLYKDMLKRKQPGKQSEEPHAWSILLCCENKSTSSRYHLLIHLPYVYMKGI